MGGSKRKDIKLTTDDSDEIDLKLSALVSSAAGFPVQVTEGISPSPDEKSIIGICNDLFARWKRSPRPKLATDVVSSRGAEAV